MYEKQFGLAKKPFSSNAEGPAVFVGPQQAKIIRSLNAGMSAVDSIVVVTGPVGVGKTTVVSRALESISPGRMVAWVRRMALAPDEVLQLLLTGFGISREANGTVQKFAAFRRLLAERAAADAQLAIVVEDTQRIGQDALIEMEALTAADSGDATGANIILMGQPELNEWLANPALARVRQRTRLRLKVDPFGAAEVQGYLTHSIRAAGGNIDRILDSRAIEMLYRCSEGIPRVINNLCESALAMAAAEKKSTLTAEFIQEVARDMLGIDVALPPPAKTTVTAAAPEPAPPAAPEPSPEPPTEASAAPDIDSTQPQKRPDWLTEQPGDGDDEKIPGELSFEVEQTSRMKAINADRISQAEKEGKAAASTFDMAPMITVDKDTKIDEDDDLPMLSQSMRIDAPKPASADEMAAENAKEAARARAEARAKAEAKAKAEARARAEAKAKAEQKARAEAKARAEQKARAEAKARAEQKARAEAKAKAEEKARAEAKAKAEQKARAEAKAKKALMPDRDTLEAAIAAANEDDAGDRPEPKPPAESTSAATDNGVPSLTLEESLEAKQKKSADFEGMAEQLGSVESLRDLTESLAETLFGNAEFEAIAAEVSAKAQPEKAGGAESSSAAEPDPEASPVMLELDNETGAAEADEPDTEEQGPEAAGGPDKITMTTTRRLDLVKQLNKPANAEDVETGKTDSPAKSASPNEAQPASIEDQMQSEMTATVKALDTDDVSSLALEEDEPEKKKSGGLFSRFSRSS